MILAAGHRKADLEPAAETGEVEDPATLKDSGAKRFGIDLVRVAGGSLWSLTGGSFPRGPHRLKGSRRILLLYYHRVFDTNEQPIYQLGIQRDVFRRQLEDLQRFFHIVPLPEALSAAAAGSHGEDLAAITFDDGYRDNYVWAFTVLRELGIPATIFLVAGLIGSKERLWYDQIRVLVERAHAPYLDLPASLGGGRLELGSAPQARRRSFHSLIDRLKACEDSARRDAVRELSERHADLLDLPDERDVLMSWEEARAMEEAGIQFGSHTLTHPLLTKISNEAVLLRELSESRKLLEERLRSPLPILAYPGGAFSPQVARAAGECGYRWALANAPGPLGPATDPLSVPRRGVGPRSSLFLGRRHSRAIFRAECEGLFDRVRRHGAERKSGSDVVATAFDGLAEAYHRARKEDPAFVGEEREILRMLPRSPSFLIEVGCGAGSTAVRLAGEGWRVVATDLSLEMLRRAVFRMARPARGLFVRPRKCKRALQVVIKY